MDASASRYARQRALEGFGTTAQHSLAAAHVVVVGAGGLGCTVLPTLAAAGVGAITVVDDDRVDDTNLARQTLYGPADVGRFKAEAAVDALRRIAPEVALSAVVARFTAASAPQLLAGVDLLVDAGDTSTSRHAADEAAAAAGIPIVWGSALRRSGEVGVAWDARGTAYRDLHPDLADDESCEIAGVLPGLCAVVGGLMATEALQLLAGDDRSGRALVVDAATGAVRTLRFRRDVAATATEPPPAPAPAVAEITPADFAELRADPSAGVVLLDVREPDEVAADPLPAAVAIPLGDLPVRLDELDPAADLVVVCRRGVRSARAAVLLRDAGFRRVRHLAGGLEAVAVPR